MTTTALTVAAPQAGQALRPVPARWAHLAAMHARSFAREPSTAAMLPVGFVAVAVLWLVSFGMLAAGLGRTDPASQTLALVLPSRPRPAAMGRIAAVGLIGSLAFFGMVVLAGLSSSAAGYAFLAALTVLAVPAVISCVRGRAARARLRKARPAGAHWFVSGVCRASGARGAGAMLIGSLCESADRAGVPLVLDAAAPALVGYYNRFGFEPTGGAEKLPGGAVVTPMSRLPRGRARA